MQDFSSLKIEVDFIDAVREELWWGDDQRSERERDWSYRGLVYHNDLALFEDWMHVHCPTSEIGYKMSLAPKNKVIIDFGSKQEVMIFKLTWGNGNG